MPELDVRRVHATAPAEGYACTQQRAITAMQDRSTQAIETLSCFHTAPWESPSSDALALND
jgi:hypothetical protein